MADPWEKDEATKPPWEDDAPTSLVPGTPGSGAAKRFTSGVAGALNPVPGIQQMVGEATDPKIGLKKTLESHFIAPQMEQFGKAKDAALGQGEFQGMSPLERASSAFGYGAAGALPLIGPAAANAGEQIGSGDVAGGLGSGAGLIGSLAIPDAVRGIGKGMMRTAEPIAENASGIAYVDRGFGRNGEGPGRTPGRAILDETSGVRPGTVSSQARTRLGEINNQLEGVVGRSTADTHLQPAIDTVGGAIQKAGERNSKATPIKLQPMLDYLSGEPTPNFTGNTGYAAGAHTPLSISNPLSPILGPTGQPIPGPPQVSYGAIPKPTVAETQPPSALLGMKRQFSDDFVQNWNPQSDTKGQLGVARQGVRALGDELHRAVPESRDLDVRASSLIPGAERSEIKALRAGPVQNMINRFGAHTGALTGAVAGGSAFGLPGALAGLAIPEMLANPTTQMIAARSLNGAGRAMQSPLVTRPLQIAPQIKPRQQQP